MPLFSVIEAGHAPIPVMEVGHAPIPVMEVGHAPVLCDGGRSCPCSL